MDYNSFNKILRQQQFVESILKYHQAEYTFESLRASAVATAAIQGSITSQQKIEKQILASSVINAFFNKLPNKTIYSSLDKMQNGLYLSSMYSKQTDKILSNLVKSEQLNKILYTQGIFTSKLSNLLYQPIHTTAYHQLQTTSKFYNESITNLALNAAAFEANKEIEIIEEITNRINDLTSEVYEARQIGKDALEKIKEIIGLLKPTTKQDWQWLMNMIVTIFFGAMGLYISYLGLKASANGATKDDIKELVQAVTSNYKSVSTHAGLEKVLATNITVRAKPSGKAYALNILKQGTVVTILNIDADWAYVSYIDSLNEGLPASGWISTKYFKKNTFSKTLKKRVNK